MKEFLLHIVILTGNPVFQLVEFQIDVGDEIDEELQLFDGLVGGLSLLAGVDVFGLQIGLGDVEVLLDSVEGAQHVVVVGRVVLQFLDLLSQHLSYLYPFPSTHSFLLQDAVCFVHDLEGQHPEHAHVFFDVEDLLEHAVTHVHLHYLAQYGTSEIAVQLYLPVLEIEDQLVILDLTEVFSESSQVEPKWLLQVALVLAAEELLQVFLACGQFFPFGLHLLAEGCLDDVKRSGYLVLAKRLAVEEVVTGEEEPPDHHVLPDRVQLRLLLANVPRVLLELLVLSIHIGTSVVGIVQNQLGRLQQLSL